MKRLFFIALLPALLSFIPAAKKVTINGVVNFEGTVQKVYLSYRVADETVTDSSDLINNRFRFEERIDEPVLAYITVSFKPLEGQARHRYEKVPVFLEPGIIKIEAKDSLKFAKITGSKSHAAYTVLMDLEKPFTAKERELRGRYIQFRKDKNEEGMKKADAEMEKLSEEKNEKVFHKYLIENPKSPIALYVLEQYAGYDINAKQIEPLYESLPAILRQSPSGIAFKERIETSKKTGVGAYAMDFTQNDTLGKPVSLSDFKGKYVLIDFWASWCGPCRAENPNVVKAFNEYKDKKFTVLGISLDQPGKQQAWLDAIHKDNLTWTHVSDLKFWDNAVAKQYGIRAIPQNLLIDQDGKIIAKNIRGEELNKKLAEVIK
jgi:peroxiredoxin